MKNILFLLFSFVLLCGFDHHHPMKIGPKVVAGIGFNTSTSTGHNTTITLSNSNFTATIASGSSQGIAYLNSSKSSGKWYFEYLISYSSSQGSYFYSGGVSLSTRENLTTILGCAANGYAIYYDGGGRVTLDRINNCNNTPAITGSTPYASGDIMRVAIDVDNGKIYAGKIHLGTQSWFNGTTSATGGDPASGVGALYTFTTNTLSFFGCSVCSYAGGTGMSITVNNGTTGNEPIGYSALN